MVEEPTADEIQEALAAYRRDLHAYTSKLHQVALKEMEGLAAARRAMEEMDLTSNPDSRTR